MSDKLVLRIEIDEMGTDGWRESVEAALADSGNSFEEELLWDIQETLARREVHVVFCGVPGEKFMNEDFEIWGKPGRIVGAALEGTSDE